MTETDRRLTEPTLLMWTLHQNHPGRRTVFTLGTGSFFNSHRVNVNICKHADTHLLSHITSWTLRDPRLDGRRANNRSQKPEGLLTFRLHPNLHYLDLQTEPWLWCVHCHHVKSASETTRQILCQGLKTAARTSICFTPPCFCIMMWLHFISGLNDSINVSR